MELYFKQASEEIFKNINFISEEGVITIDNSKATDLENIIAELCLELPTVEKKYTALATALTYDYMALLEKYNKQFKTAVMLYNHSIYKDMEIIKQLINYLEDLLGVYEEEPSEALYSVLKIVATSTAKPFNNAKANIDSYFINLSELAEGIKEFTQLKELNEERYSIYFELINKIKKLDLPEGSVN